MRIQKRYKDPKDYEWFDTTLDECLDKTEIAQYYKPGTVIDILKSGVIVSTPFAQFRLVECADDSWFD
ncbi:MAG: hypothetical protein ACXACR_14615 [Candidatus Hodarchaeales archaeon]|jgi:hypothetical protein